MVDSAVTLFAMLLHRSVLVCYASNCFDPIAIEIGVRFSLPRCMKSMLFNNKCRFCYQTSGLCFSGSVAHCESFVLNETSMLPHNHVNPLQNSAVYYYRKSLILMGIITVAVMSLLIWCLYICFVLYMGGHYAGYYSDLAQEYATIIRLWHDDSLDVSLSECVCVHRRYDWIVVRGNVLWLLAVVLWLDFWLDVVLLLFGSSGWSGCWWATIENDLVSHHIICFWYRNGVRIVDRRLF